jgi:predicted transcriptional regulator
VSALPDLQPEALHGLAGEYATAVEPYTEACTAGVLVSTLVSFGSAVGRNAFMPVGGITHHPNEFALLVGPTATARKGDSMQLGLRPIEHASLEWRECQLGGFGSGEAVVDAVRDPDIRLEGDETKVVDAGATDKRLLVFEEELAHVIAVAGREGSTLSSLLRKAWDGRRLENRTKGRRLIATGAHVSALTGITPEELIRRMPDTEVANGFMNRFLIVAVARARTRSRPTPIPATFDRDWGEAFREALAFAREHPGPMAWSDDGGALWDRAYVKQLSVERAGLAGSACARAEPHALRLAMIFALLDCSKTIQLDHVQAALALWNYCEQSTRLIFGDRLGDPDADAIVREVRERGKLTRWEVNNFFGRNRSADQLDRALQRLIELKLLREEREDSGGRPTTIYFPYEENEVNEESATKPKAGAA